MKKLIIVLLLACATAFAGELQNYFEASIKKTTNNQFKGLTKKQLIKDDYQAYLNGDGSLYGVLLFSKDNIKEQNKLKYINQAISQYDCLLKNNEQICKTSPINIKDEEYRKFDEEFRSIIGGCNAILY